MPVTPEEVLAHYGVPGMKWGRRKGESSSGQPTERQQRRAQYKQDLKDGRLNQAHGREVTEEQAKAMRTNGIRTTAALLATYGAVQVGSHFLQKGIVSNFDKKMADFENAGKAFTNENLKAVGNLSTFALRLDSDGTWR